MDSGDVKPKRDDRGLPDDDVVRALRTEDPERGAPELTAAYLARIEEGLHERERGVRVSRTAGGLGIVGIVLAVVAIGAPAVAGVVWFQAQDLVQNRDPVFGVATPSEGETIPEGTEDRPGSTWIDPSADDFDEWAVTALDLGLPVPAGMDASALAKSFATEFSNGANEQDGGVVIQTAGIQSAYAATVRCFWIEEYVAEGDSDAPAVLKDSADWPDLDPSRFSDMDRLEEYKAGLRSLDPVMIQATYDEFFCGDLTKNLTAEPDDIP